MVFMVNNVATFWFGCPGVLNLFGYYGWFGLEADIGSLTGIQTALGWGQLLLYFFGIGLVLNYVHKRSGIEGLHDDARRYSWLAAYIVRTAFWAVLLIGLADFVVSFLRVEGYLDEIIGEQLATELGRPQFRGHYLHYPLLLLSGLIALLTRSLSFVWLAVLVVFAEFQIVVSRFVFSYEQAFMGDLVRFWYAALFLFASSYALVEEGHVRVDVLYAHFSKRTKAWTNAVGSMLLGMPICFTILLLGMWGKGSSLNSPILSFEISQSGFGMYVQYLMAGFLIVFALSMIIQFAGLFLESVAVLLGDSADEEFLESQHEPI
ncbi:MAG: TRAP transporter small permease subunit [Gammaproteobacteria bacterium]|nr:TRAP transporter small permease subunit [Gammaproteobacteria bacterium]